MKAAEHTEVLDEDRVEALLDIWLQVGDEVLHLVLF